MLFLGLKKVRMVKLLLPRFQPSDKFPPSKIFHYSPPLNDIWNTLRSYKLTEIIFNINPLNASVALI